MRAKQVRGQGNEKNLQPDMEVPDLDGYKGSGPNRVCAHGRIRGGCGGFYYAGRGQQYKQDIECDVGGLYPELARRLAAVRLGRFPVSRYWCHVSKVRKSMKWGGRPRPRRTPWSGSVYALKTQPTRASAADQGSAPPSPFVNELQKRDTSRDSGRWRGRPVQAPSVAP